MFYQWCFSCFLLPTQGEQKRARWQPKFSPNTVYVQSILKFMVLKFAVNCSTGTVYDHGLNECVPCPKGQYMPHNGRFKCLPCPIGVTTVAMVGAAFNVVGLQERQCVFRGPRRSSNAQYSAVPAKSSRWTRNVLSVVKVSRHDRNCLNKTFWKFQRTRFEILM